MKEKKINESIQVDILFNNKEIQKEISKEQAYNIVNDFMDRNGGELQISIEEAAQALVANIEDSDVLLKILNDEFDEIDFGDIYIYNDGIDIVMEQVFGINEPEY